VTVTTRGDTGKVRLMDLEQAVRTGMLKTFIEAEMKLRNIKDPKLNY
jgi:hypothetical protein